MRSGSGPIIALSKFVSSRTLPKSFENKIYNIFNNYKLQKMLSHIKTISIRTVNTAVAKAGIKEAHTLPKLPYEFNALEPIISRDIMAIHYTKHHATYVANLNATQEKIEQALSKADFETVISLQGALKFNGGGHINHSIFWENLSPSGGKPSTELEKAICEAFGSVEQMQKKLAEKTVAIQGSGWGWLGYNKEAKKLQIATCANQDPLKATTGLVPIFGIDVWEHAYYLQYKNVRADYVKAIFEIANWNDLNKRYQSAAGC